MVLVDHDTVEPYLSAILKLVEVHAVQLVGFFGAEILVGKHQVVVAQFLGLILGIGRVSHLSKEKYFFDHPWPPCRRCYAEPASDGKSMELRLW